MNEIVAQPQIVEWAISDTPVAYPAAVRAMEDRVAAIHAGTARELVWLLEHPPLYTAGTSARDGDLLAPDRFPVYRTGRGGQFTYHGPGQRVAYVMLDLKRRAARDGAADAAPAGGGDVRRFVHDLEEWLIRTLDRFAVRGERRDGRVGIWVDMPPERRLERGREAKIAALGVRVRHWITYHGVALNVEPDLDHFSGIVPCGISEYGVTSLWDLGLTPMMTEVDAALRATFAEVFGLATMLVPPPSD